MRCERMSQALDKKVSRLSKESTFVWKSKLVDKNEWSKLALWTGSIRSSSELSEGTGKQTSSWWRNCHGRGRMHGSVLRMSRLWLDEPSGTVLIGLKLFPKLQFLNVPKPCSFASNESICRQERRMAKDVDIKERSERLKEIYKEENDEYEKELKLTNNEHILVEKVKKSLFHWTYTKCTPN